MDVRNSVKVINETLARFNTAGVVMETDGKEPPKTLTVKFDTDGETETLKASDLVVLGTN